MDPITLSLLSALTPAISQLMMKSIEDYHAKNSKGTYLYVKHGSRHKLVADIQKALVEQGSLLRVDGIYGRRTQLEILKFQANHDLRADGVCGPFTIALLLGNTLLENITVPEDSFPKALVLQRGSKGIITKAVQEALLDFGCMVDVDGIYGKDTYDAVCRFQAYLGIPVDGKCGPQTFAILFKQDSVVR